jgi:hypothetical protein
MRATARVSESSSSSSSSSWFGVGVAKDKGKKQEAGVSLVTRETDESGSRTKDDEEEDWRNLSGAAH